MKYECSKCSSPGISYGCRPVANTDYRLERGVRSGSREIYDGNALDRVI